MFKREITHKQKIIITDGMPSSGKALICNLISSLPKVDPWVMLHPIENIVALNKMGKLDNKISEYLLKTNHNVLFHDNILLRHANFRKADITSVQKNVKYNSLKKRLSPNETDVIKKYKNKVIFHYCLHFTAIAKKILFQTFKDKLLYIQIYRSPITLSMIERIANWTLQIEKSKSRDGHIKLYNKKHKKNLPYFLKDNSSQYLSANKYEKAIMIIEKNLNKKLIYLKKSTKRNVSIEIIIPFENLLKNPKKYIKSIGKHINSKVDRLVLKSFEKNKVPRNINLEKEKLITLKFLKNKIRPRYFNKLLYLEKFYKQRVLNKF